MRPDHYRCHRATGTAGSRVTARLKGRDVAVVEISRTHGVDLITGQGLSEALEGVDVVIDVSNPMPADDHSDITPSPRPPTTWWVHAPRRRSSDWWCRRLPALKTEAPPGSRIKYLLARKGCALRTNNKEISG